MNDFAPIEKTQTKGCDKPNKEKEIIKSDEEIEKEEFLKKWREL